MLFSYVTATYSANLATCVQAIHFLSCRSGLKNNMNLLDLMEWNQNKKTKPKYHGQGNQRKPNQEHLNQE